MRKQYTFSGEAAGVLDLIENGRQNLFVTGEAGTGKSTLLEHIIDSFGRNMVVLAPTGIAAIHVKGSTIHSFFRLKPGFELDEARNMKITKTMTDRYKTLDTLLIDEVSMVRADLFDAMDVFLRRVRGSRQDFGGVRMILFGDLFQLPPVVTREEDARFTLEYGSPWFFSAKVFDAPDLFSRGFLLRKIVLKKVYRQNDARFVQMLNAVRNMQLDSTELGYLDAFVLRGQDREALEDDRRVHLVTTNEQAARVNYSRLTALEGKMMQAHSRQRGEVGKALPNTEVLQMKKGARIIFLNNDQEGRWVNGSLGEIRDFHSYEDGGETEVEVELDNGKTVFVEPHTWPISRYRFRAGKFVREETGSFTQYPFKLAWAITIHKSQGLTFERVYLDLGRGSFAHGQAYVALSRCTGPEALLMSRNIRSADIILDQRIRSFLIS